ncbi:MAG: hypothetical protein ACO3Z2_01795 [Chitinophagaceae bacterium]
MKRMISTKLSRFTLIAVAITASTLLLQSCQKSFDKKLAADYYTGTGSTIQVFVGTVGASRNYIYVDGQPVNGSALSTGNLFPGTGFGYSVKSGLRNMMVRDTLSTTTQANLVFAQNFDIGNNYMIFTFDTITAPKQKTVRTPITVPSDTTCRVRFANFAYNGIAQTPAIDIVSLGKNEIVATNVRYTDVTDFIVHPSRIGTEAFQIRLAGTTTVLATSTISTLLPQRSYTVVYRGSHRATSGTSIRAATLVVNY